MPDKPQKKIKLTEYADNNGPIYQPNFTIKDFQAPHFQDARSGISLWESPFESKSILHGIPVSNGIAIGEAFFLHRKSKSPKMLRTIKPEEIEIELARIDAAITALSAEFARVSHRIAAELSEESAIINAHIMICQDPKLLALAKGFVTEDKFSAEMAITAATDKISRQFEEIDSDYLRERIYDIKLVGDRIIAAMDGKTKHSCTLPKVSEKIVLLAHNLSPADTMSLSPNRFIAIATELGGKTSHTGILARSLKIPCVTGVDSLEALVNDGDRIIIDGLKGQVIINPDESELARYATLQTQLADYEKRVRKGALLPAETTDGIRFNILGNIELPEEAEEMLRQGAEGVGLYRTEFAFMHHEEFPTEEELYENYKKLAMAMHGRPVVFRTFDVGSDKAINNKNAHENLEEANPALGLRSIRYCLRHKEIFRTQLKAILRASIHGNCSIMFPMISGLSELKQAKSILNEARQELTAENLAFNHNIPVGIMIELPSAVLVADSLAKEADFFSIGTNDLIQYSLGIDRGNKHVAYLYKPLHPAIIRAIKIVTDMAHKAGISVSVCGEMASDPYCLPILMAIGVDELSMAPQAIPGIKHLIRNSNVEEYAELLRQTDNISEIQIEKLVRQCLYRRFHNELGFFTLQE